jgi:branched-chain amino acid transport system substrate-binding protein
MRKLVLVLVAVLVLAAVAAWFWTQSAMRQAAPGNTAGAGTASTTPPAANLPDLVIGLAGPFTGPQAAFGQQMQIGARFAVEAINANGGVEGRKVTLIEKDDGCDPDRARAVAADMVAEKVVAVIGHFCSAASQAAYGIYAPAQVAMVTPASTDPRLTDSATGQGGGIFRSVWRDDYQGLIAAALIKQTLPGKKFGVVRDGTLYGQQLSAVFKAALTKLELGDAAADLVLGPALSAKQAAAKARSAGLGVVFVAAEPATAGGFVKALREAGVTATVLGPDALASPDYTKAAGAAADGTIITFARNPLDYPTAAKAIERLTQAGHDPSGYVLTTFAAAQVLSAALGPLVKADPAAAIDGARLATTIHSHSFPTVIGDIAFDAKGDLTKPGVVYYVWKGGKLTAM